jgi:murein L,D-transpeptidase YafK
MLAWAILIPVLAISAAAEAAEPRRVIDIYKKDRRMTLSVDGEVVRTFKIGLGAAPEGDKQRQGDSRTPEGDFYVAWKNPQSAFHRFLGLSYPMPRHAERGLSEKLINRATYDEILAAIKKGTQPPQYSRLGGMVGIHGGGGEADWTLGCIAVSDAEAKWLFDQTKIGDRIVVHP